MLECRGRYITLILAIFLFGSISLAATAKSGDKSFGYSLRYGVVTPSQVYSQLQNYESLFMYYVKKHKKNMVDEVNEIKLISVSKKTPDDAYQKLLQLADSLDKLSKKLKLSTVNRIIKQKAKALPAEVFLQTANNLDSMVSILNKIEPGKVWGNYYKLQTYKQSKKPSDVYVLADLLIKRLDLVL